jgi:alpha-amylase
MHANRRGWLRGAAFALAIVLAASGWPLRAQAGFDDDRVMLQGFYWESYRNGHPEKFSTYSPQSWYALVKQQADAIRAARFDLIWLPPPSYAGQYSAGYDPRELWRFEGSYGTQAEHRALLETLLKAGVEPVADIVINHRNGSTGWADFKNPEWGTWAICRTDEAFSNPASGLTATPDDQKGDCEERASYMFDLTYNYESFRDIAHTNKQVRDDIQRYLLSLRSLGYRGWRYDMVHGYHAKWIGCYNAVTTPTFSVGEYDWGAHNQMRGWVWATSTTPATEGADHLRASSSVFDFTTQFSLKAINDSRYATLYGYGSGIGMVGDTTDGLPWKNRAVTFVENHDVGYRTNEDGTPQANNRFDNFPNGWQVEQAYAQVLTHPGLPTVYWKHYFEWGQDLQNKIKALINARKVAGVHAGSALYLQDNARAAGVYAARVDGRNGQLYVRIGGSDKQWQPSDSGYDNYREYAQGAGWKVWVRLPGSSEFQQAPLRGPLPVPEFKPASNITPPANALCN